MKKLSKSCNLVRALRYIVGGLRSPGQVSIAFLIKITPSAAETRNSYLSNTKLPWGVWGAGAPQGSLVLLK